MSRPGEDCEVCRAFAGLRNLGWTNPALVVHINLAISAPIERFSPRGAIRIRIARIR
jgi:hypothetical protein